MQDDDDEPMVLSVSNKADGVGAGLFYKLCSYRPLVMPF